MIEFKNICIYQIRDTKTLIDGLSFTLNDGEKLAIIGEEGNGKSTLLKWIYDPALVEGYAEVNGQRRLGMSKLGYLPQELSSELGELSVYEYLLQSCALDGVEKRIISRTAKALSLPIELFYSDQRMDTLSGGERVKLQLGSLLMQYCDVLLLDEPTNDLDLATLKWLEGFVAQSRQSILYISHDEVLLENTAQGIIHLEQVRRKTIARATVEHLGYSDYMKQRQSKMDRQRQQSTFEHDEFIKKKERYLSIYNAVESAQNSVSRADPSTGRLLKKKMHAVKSLGGRLDKEKESLTQLPEAEWAILPKWEEGIELPSGKVVLDFELPLLSCGQRVLAKSIALKVVGNKKLAIIGNNGCGKSTLIKLIWDSLKDRRDIKALLYASKL